MNASTRGIALWVRVSTGFLLLLGVTVACGDRRIVFCDAGYDETMKSCALTTAGAGGGGGGGAGGSAGGTAGSGGAGGASGNGGAGGGGAAGIGGSQPDLDASVPLDAGDAGDTPDAAAVP